MIFLKLIWTCFDESCRLKQAYYKVRFQSLHRPICCLRFDIVRQTLQSYYCIMKALFFFDMID